MSWIKPKPAHQSILSLILITVGLALLTAFILFLSDQLAVARTPGSIINSLGLQLHLLLCCGPHPSPFYHHLCSDVWVDCHDWDQGYHWSPWEFIFSLTHPPPAFVHGGDPSLPLVSCTDSHAENVWCKSEQIKQKGSDPMDLFGFQVMLWGQTEAFSTQQATCVLEAKF